MARYLGPTCKPCRRARQSLCNKKSCAYDRRPYPPGEHGRGRIRESQYQIQLREKQKARYIYGVLERQFRRYYEKAAKNRGITGTVLLQLLERRLDNVVFRSQFALTRPMARQLVNHGHVTVNGKKVSIPSFQVREGDVVALREKSKDLVAVQQALDVAEHPVPDWVDVEPDDRKITVRQLPSRDQIDTQIQEQLIVELYSK
ncbi:MAG: 30S ribosomal protein S4 [Acidimicrobiia bacterium]|nr:30S ribosomal protein S4 [Acidimicrobiia bacterium]NNC74243.1 30S ribosomal protein S4 [Acidimicrobiia bacterium]